MRSAFAALFRSIPILAFLALLTAAPSAAQVIQTVGNSVYEVHVSKTALNPVQVGSWNAVTGPLHEVGAGKDVLYRQNGVRMNFSSLRVYRPGNPTYVFGGRGGGKNLDPLVTSEGDSPLAAAGLGWRTVWNIAPENLRVIQDVIVTGTSTENSAIYHTVEIANIGQQNVKVGWRNLYDWDANDPDQDDGPSNQLESTCGQIARPATTVEFSHSPVTAQIARVSIAPGTPTYQPLLGLAFDPGYRSDLPVTPPDEYAFVSWPDAQATSFDYTPSSQNADGDSGGLSWWGRDAARARSIPPGTSIRLTQTIFAQEPGACPKPCLRSVTEQVLCAADGTEDFLYTLNVRNLSTAAIHHLFLLSPEVVNDPSRQVTLEPSYFSLTANPLGINADRQLPQIRIKGAKPGDKISFMVTAQNETEEQCCAIEKTITLPECDCAQIVSSSGPTCVSFFRPSSYKYTFTFQNLFDEDMQYLLLTPMTGSPGSLSPNIYDLSKIQSDGVLDAETREKATFTTAISGASAGSKVCFQVTGHDPALHECCAIQQCVSLPDCRLRIDDFDRLGHTDLQPTQLGLFISGISSSGEDGVAIDTGGAFSFDAEWLPIETKTLPEGARLKKTFKGTVDGVENSTILTTESVKAGENVELRADFSPIGATRQSMEFYLHGELVGTATNQTQDSVLRYYAKEGQFETDVHYFLSPLCSFFSGNCILFFTPYLGITFNDGPATLPAFNLSTDTIIIFSEDATAEVGGLSEVLIQAASIPSITLLNANTAADCNQNGVPDYQDISTRTSTDVNQNAIPDECEGGIANLDLSLNTGFDQASGTVLPFGSLPNGTSDDDWQVLNAPAKLVIGPHSAWHAPLADSRWISVDPNQGLSSPSRPTLQFENCFCISDKATTAALDIQLFADDIAQVFLNGSPLGAPGGDFFKPTPLHVQLTGAVGEAGPFKHGENCLRVQVQDAGRGVTGLDLAGTVHAENGSCAN